MLTSPSNRLDEYFPPRKSQRLAAKNAKDVFKQARQRGGSPNASPLTGYLSSIPHEVGQFGLLRRSTGHSAKLEAPLILFSSRHLF